MWMFVGTNWLFFIVVNYKNPAIGPSNYTFIFGIGISMLKISISSLSLLNEPWARRATVT